MKPIISIHRIGGVVENGWVEVHKFLQCYWGRLLMSILVWKLSHYSSHKLTIQLKLLHHCDNIGWRWRIVGHPAKTSGSNLTGVEQVYGVIHDVT